MWGSVWVKGVFAGTASFLSFLKVTMTLPLSASPVPSLSLSSSLSMWEVLLSRFFWCPFYTGAVTVPHYMDKAAESGAWEPAPDFDRNGSCPLGANTYNHHSDGNMNCKRVMTCNTNDNTNNSNANNPAK